MICYYRYCHCHDYYYCLKVDGDPREAATQRAAATRAIALLRAREPPCVDTLTLRDETWRRVAARWLECIRELSPPGPKLL